MENLNIKEILNNILNVLKSWSFWQKFLSLILLPLAIGFLTYYLITLAIYWFAALSFVLGLIYFTVALIFNISDKDFDIKLPGGWLSIKIHDKN